MQIKEIMKKAVTIALTATVRDAAKIMVARGIGSLVIVEKGKLVGIVTERDVLKYFSKAGKPGERINAVMSKNVKTIESSSEISDAAAIMTRNKIKRLPVVEKGKLVGIVTATDLVANAESFDEPFFF